MKLIELATNLPRTFVIGVYVAVFLAAITTGAATFDSGQDPGIGLLLGVSGVALLAITREFRHASCERLHGHGPDHRCFTLPGDPQSEDHGTDHSGTGV
jgi:hypothetical protein